MGRIKQVPKRKIFENEHFYDYVPIIKKKKPNRNKTVSEKFFLTTHSIDINQALFLGTITIGSTDNAFPERYAICKISFKNSEKDCEVNSIILNLDDSYVIVKLIVDIYCLKGIFILFTFI